MKIVNNIITIKNFPLNSPKKFNERYETDNTDNAFAAFKILILHSNFIIFTDFLAKNSFN